MKWLSLLLLCLFLVTTVLAQGEQGPVLWQDDFEDEEVAPLTNVGWIFYGEEDIAGQIVEQREGELFIQAGSYGGLAGVGLVETNGVPQLVFDENGDPTPETMAALIQDNYSNPNQDLTFQINFPKISVSFFILATRMDLDSSRGDSDPTEAFAYTVFVSPLEDVVRIGRYDAPMAALDPGSWTYFGEGSFDFELDVYYYMRIWLKDGDFKFKVWEGELEDEPEEWLIVGQDPNPRVSGNFTMFGLLGAPPGGDQVILDNIVMRSTETTAVEALASNAVPKRFDLKQNFPNPFNPATEISFDLPHNSHVTLTVYNSLGQKMATLEDGEYVAGSYSVTWDASEAPSGVYFYRLEADGFAQTMKMMLMK